MTRRFRVTIGGVTYNVDVEELGQAAGGPAAVPTAFGQAPASWQTGAAQVAAGPAVAPAAVPAGYSGVVAASVPAGYGGAAPAAAAPVAAAPAAVPATATVAPAPAATTPAPAATPAAAAPAAASPSGEGQPVCAPLPGMIVDVKVAVGQQVNAGDVVAVLEAMKMENDITSPYTGTVKQVLVSKGASVSMNDPLVVIG